MIGSEPIYEHLFSELYQRQEVYNELQKGVYGSLEQADLFRDKSKDKIVEPKPFCTIFDWFYAEELTVGEAKAIISIKDRHDSSPLHQDNKAIISLNLAYASDNDIIEELRPLLKQIREDLNVKPIKKYNLKDLYEKLFFYGVFEYLDLTLWAKAHKYTIESPFLSKTIKDGMFEYYEILGKVQRNAMSAISDEYLEQLNIAANKQKR
jgi:hypothetical protein